MPCLLVSAERSTSTIQPFYQARASLPQSVHLLKYTFMNRQLILRFSAATCSFKIIFWSDPFCCSTEHRNNDIIETWIRLPWFLDLYLKARRFFVPLRDLKRLDHKPRGSSLERIRPKQLKRLPNLMKFTKIKFGLFPQTSILILK